MVDPSSTKLVSKTTEQSSTGESVQPDTSYIKRIDEQSLMHLFDGILKKKPLFIDREWLSTSYIPATLPHREHEITELANILAPALDLNAPSNIIVYGKPGVGKTAAITLVGKELERKAIEIGKRVSVIHINCQYTDTLYRILNTLAQQFIDHLSNDRPFIGLPTDEVYAKTLSLLDTTNRAVIIVLDEIDKLKEDTALYLLTRINNDLHNTKVSIIGISNHLRFTDFLDARVKSSLSQETIVFNPYDAEQLQDILRARSQQALKPDVLSVEVIPLCAALAAQEHGDARKALDLLRVSIEIAERRCDHAVTSKHVRLAQNKIEKDRIAEVIHSLPAQERLLVHAIRVLQRCNKHMGNPSAMITGELYSQYVEISKTVHYTPLSQRRVADFISELDSLGIISARVISKGRYGTTREIQLMMPLTELEHILQDDEFTEELGHIKMKNQTKLL
jgi:cell division control protein 6